MSFIWPNLLFSLLLVPVVIFIYLRLQRRRAQAASRFGALGWGAGTAQGPKIRRHIPPALFLVSFTILLAALARPQATVSLPKQEGIVILAFDVSGSMAAEDMEPNRMEAAKAAAAGFIQRQPESVQVGVVAFSDSGLSVQVPTNEQETVLATIKRLSPQRGTSLGQGIYSALDTIAIAQAGDPPDLLQSGMNTPEPTATPTRVPGGTYIPATIVLLTDGENNESPDPLTAADEAAGLGVRIYTVGVGSPEGTVLEIEGFNVHTQLNEALLQQISELSGGEYYHASTQEDLQEIYDSINPQLVFRPESMEITALFAGAGVLLLIAGAALSLVWFSRLP